MALIDYKDLPGKPRLGRVKQVKRNLRDFGISPKNEIWIATWSWADEIAGSYLMKRIWPAPRHISSQYVLLMLCEMKRLSALRLPVGADTHISDQAMEMLGNMQGPLFLSPSEDTKRLTQVKV